MSHLKAIAVILYLTATPTRSAEDEDVMMTTDIPWRDDSCLYRCVEAYFPGRACYCNEACDQYENCCYDYYPICRPDFVWSDEWLEHGEHLYKYFHDKHSTAHSSREQCAQHGGLLVSIGDEQEADFVTLTVLKKRTLSVFMGGQDIDGDWLWADGMRMPLPTEAWHQWYAGQPENSDGSKGCSVLTNYMFWSSPMFMMDSYIWRSFSCEVNANIIQGYVCEKTLLCEPSPCQNNGSCVYVGGPAEYSCLCQPGYVGNLCEYELIEDAMWTECGQTNLTAGHDVITLTSPLFPQSYPPNARCEWRISTEPGKTIKLGLEMLDIELSKECVFDHLTVYDGSSKSADTAILGPVCGDMQDNTQLRASFTSANSEVIVEFSTDHSREHKGFAISYVEEVCGQGTGSSGCGSPGLYTASCGSIELHAGPEVPEEPCQISIKLPAGRLVNLTFTHFHIHDSGKSCAEGGLNVHDGSPITSGNMIGSFCGFRFPWSIQSETNHVTLRLFGSSWRDGYGIGIEYNTIDPSSWSRETSEVTHTVTLGTGSTHTLDTEGYDTNTRSKGREVRRFSVRSRPGERIIIESMSGTWNDFDTVKIYDGHDFNSRLLIDLGDLGSDDVNAHAGLVSTGYKIYVILDRAVGSQSRLDLALLAMAFTPELSGCYRPHYSDRADVSTSSLENHLVSPLKPVVVMVSEHSVASSDPGYDQGLYCKWTIRGEPGRALSLTFLDANIPPLTENCDYDGVVVYDGDIMYGPYCGSSEFSLLETKEEAVEVVFYSDTAYRRRTDGVLRILVQDKESCGLRQMESVRSLEYQSDCGSVLSPNFPGMVAPGQWTWTVSGLEPSQYFAIYVHYVRGPGVKDDCNQYFKLNEIPHDSGVLKQQEVSILTVCGSTDLFIPKHRFRLPPYQKLGIELNTLSNSIAYQWQYKLSYSRETMAPPVTTSALYECPDDYTYYRGSCYKYFPWVYRHYQDEYNWQQTWQQSLEHCQTAENATLVSIHDEQEAYFIKYMLTNDWFWDKAASIQSNGRLIFIGLHNKYGRYEWTDHSQLGYADWYVPPEPWQQPTLGKTALGTDFLDLRNPQPTADVGSVCSGMIITGPFASLSWSKVPCDFPIFRSGVICEKAATKVGVQNNVDIPAVNPTDAHISKLCPRGWFMVLGRCLQLLTHYEAVRGPETAEPWNYDNATQRCADYGGTVVSMDQNLLDKLRNYFVLWRHDTSTGDIWVKGSDAGLNIIKVHKENHQDEVTHYDIFTVTEDITVLPAPRNVLCETLTLDYREECGDQEFTCGDMSCINVDGICDGVADCPDLADEYNCECSESTYECGDGQCIPISLYCDFRQDCGDGSDEYNCVVEGCGADDFTCSSGQCIPLLQMCDFKADCRDGSDELDVACEGFCRGMQCFSGTCIPSSLKADLVSDCPGLTAEDEVQRSTLTFFEIYKEGAEYDNTTSNVGCDDGDVYVQCREGAPRCYTRASTCVYDTVRVDDGAGLEIQATCRDGSHLRDFCGVTECPAMFHCPASYCLPHRKVCDGLRDCPDGADELNCTNYTCPGLFRCKGEPFCISHMEVCDGTVHCPRYGDDEKYCFHKSGNDEISELCASGCNCTGHIIDCTGALLTDILNITATAEATKALLLANNRFQLLPSSLVPLRSLGRLVLSRNQLVQLPPGLFTTLGNLYDLDLSHNQLEALQPEIFRGLVSLRKLNLDQNMLHGLQQETLAPLTSLHHLVLTNNPLQQVAQDVFEMSPRLRQLNTDAYKFCCIAPQTEICTPEADQFSSCKDLMANPTLQLSIWVLGFCACVGNFFVVIWRMLQKNTLVSSFFIVHLGISDFLMGVYLIIIASVDAYYRGVYIVYADSWTTSGLCQFAGILAMLSSEVSVFMLTAITADRCLKIMFPLKMGNYRMKHARIVVICGWIVCFFLTILPATGIPYFGDAFFGRTGVCLPFQVTNDKLPGWEYSVFIFLVLNLFSFILIFAGYACIFLKVKESIQNMKEKSTSTTDEYSLAKKLAVIVATDFLCWVPIILIGFAALGGAEISPQVSAWIAVFILPLNSAVNPLLYTISALDCGKKKRAPTSSMTGSTAVTRGTVSSIPLQVHNGTDKPAQQTANGVDGGHV